jgi:MFS family permease
VTSPSLRARLGPLVEPDFRNLWLAQTVSQVGSQVSALALPLVAILVLGASAFEVALLGAVEFLPFLLFTLPAGAWVDRISRRRILMTTDLGRAVVLALVPLLYIANVLTVWQLYVIGFATGTLTVFFDIAYQAFVPELVDREGLPGGNARLEVSRSAAQILGPGLGGLLIGVLTAPVAILADALSYLVSAGFLVRIRRRTAVARGDPAAPRSSVRADIVEGLRFYRREPLLLASSGAITTLNFTYQIAYSIYLVFVVRELRLTPELIGLTFSISSIGLLIGALVAVRVGQVLGIGRALIASFTSSAVAMLCVAVATPETAVALLSASGIVLGIALMITNVNGLSLRQAVTPDALQGRVNATGRWINWSAIPLGSLVGGALVGVLGLRGTFLAGTLLSLLSLPWLIFTPLGRLRGLPAAPNEPIADPGVALSTPTPQTPG